MPSVYLETTIPSYLVARLSPDGELAAYAAAARVAASVHASTAAEATVLRSRNTVLQRETAGLHERVQHLEARCDAYEHENQVVRRTIADIHGYARRFHLSQDSG